MKTKVASAFLCLFLAMCAGAQEQREGIVCGTVYWFGQPFAVTVSIDGNGIHEKVVTDWDGFYWFKVPAGEYRVTSPGPWATEMYRTVDVNIRGGKMQTVDFWFW